MRATVLLFHFSEKDRRNRLTRALLPLHMKIKEIPRERYLQPVGWLAGEKEVQPVEEVYTGEDLAGEMLLMAGLSGNQVDQVLQAVRRSGIGPIPYKAVLTEGNKNWNVLQLFAEIKAEHEQMRKE